MVFEGVTEGGGCRMEMKKKYRWTKAQRTEGVVEGEKCEGRGWWLENDFLHTNFDVKQTFADHRVVFVVDDFDVVRLLGGGGAQTWLRRKRGARLWVEGLNADPK